LPDYLIKGINILISVAPYILGFFSFRLILYAGSELKQMPKSNKFRLLFLLSITMFIIVSAIFLNFWLEKPFLNRLALLLGYLFVYLCLSFLSFLFVAFSLYFIHTGLDANYVIVLGTGLDEEGKIGSMLKYRLDGAISYVKKQEIKGKEPASLIVSGGKATNKDVAEAVMMQRYLIERGIKEQSIYVERDATDTLENFLYSQRFIPQKSNIVFVTNTYHLLRSGLIARRIGVKAKGLPAKTPLRQLPVALVREYLALVLMYRYFYTIVISLVIGFFYYL